MLLLVGRFLLMGQLPTSAVDSLSTQKKTTQFTHSCLRCSSSIQLSRVHFPVVTFVLAMFELDISINVLSICFLWCWKFNLKTTTLLSVCSVSRATWAHIRKWSSGKTSPPVHLCLSEGVNKTFTSCDEANPQWSLAWSSSFGDFFTWDIHLYVWPRPSPVIQ